jgi:branched-chain amino acid transport system permease protein
MMGWGLSVMVGMIGLLDLGYIAFYAIGAYTFALLAVDHAWSFWQALPVVVIFAAVAAALIGGPVLRLRGDYFAIVTLGFAEIVRLAIISEKEITNGGQGLPGVPRLISYFSSNTWNDVAFALLLTLTCVVVVWLLRQVTRSPYGRLIRAIRDDETALLALGKNPARFKTQVLMLGNGLAGLAGAFYAHYINFVTPDQYTSLVTFYVWMSIIMGGVGRLGGAVLGAFLLVAFLEGSRFIRDLVPGISEVAMSNIRLAAVGLALILFMRFAPHGLLGRKQ